MSSPRGVAERVVEAVLFGCAGVSAVATLGIIGVLAVETVAFFREVSFAQFFLDTQWTPLFADKHFGIWALASGTLLTTVVAILIALPLGLLAAIHLSELASPRTRAIAKPLLEVLAGVPSIVFGYFALIFLTPFLQRVTPNLSGFNALSPGIVMGVMMMPLISSLCEDALHAVPRALREGAYALGASQASTILRVVVPAASSGIFAAVILAVSRAIGETMIVALAAGQQPRLTLDPRVPIETMTAFIVQVAFGDVAGGTLEHRTIYAVGSALFVTTLVMNVLSHRVARRYRRLG